MSSPIQHCSSDMMHSGSWNEMRKRNKTSSFTSPFMKKSPINKGCADTDEGCIRSASDGTYYILNNRKGGTWRSGFASKEKAAKQIAAIHAK